MQKKHNLSLYTQEEALGDLLDKLGIDGMTDEESDEEDGEAFLIAHQPVWRSSELSLFLDYLDLRKSANTMQPRRVIGEKSETALVILGLPTNCYCDTWLSQFQDRHLIETNSTPAIMFPDLAL